MEKLYENTPSFGLKSCLGLLVFLLGGVFSPVQLMANTTNSGDPVSQENQLFTMPELFGNVTSLTASPNVICPGDVSTITANGLTGGSARQWWLDVGAQNGTYEAGTDINLGTGASINATGNVAPFLSGPSGTSYTIRMRETVTVAGMPPTVTVTNASTTLTVRPVPVTPPAGYAVCRSDNAINLATLIPSASSFSGNGVAGTTFTPANVSPTSLTNVTITVNYACPLTNGTTSAPFGVNIYEAPNATINDASAACTPSQAGTKTISLLTLTSDQTTTGGAFSILSGGGTINGTNLEYTTPGCFHIRYTLPNPNGCDNGILVDDAYLVITEAPTTSFTIGSGATDCYETGSAPRVISVTANSLPVGGTYLWSVTTTGGLHATLTNATSMTPTITVDFVGAPDYSAGSISICLEETIPAPAGACGTNATPNSCTTSLCKTISIVQVPNCNNDCPGIVGSDPCEVNTNPDFTFTCSFFSINLGQVFFADVHGYNGQEEAISCNDPEVCVEYDAQFMIGGLSQSDLPSFSDLPLVGGLCDLLQFCICVDLGFLGDIEIRPFGWIPSSFCDDDILTFLLDAFGNGQGYQVWADTDGDGNFDTKVDEQNLNNLMNACVPNNVPGQGTITVRIVASANGAPKGPCQDPADSYNLLDALPIKAIPLIGNTLDYLLEVAGCGVDIGFSDVDDYKVFVYNDQPPSFVNCPATYTFSDGPNCAAFANWSAPVATDNCDKTVVNNVTQLTNSADWPNTIPVNQTLTSGQFVTYQPGGNNDYTVVYEATACNGLKSYCDFTVTISPGQQPSILCPANLVIKTDVDLCSKVVTGITPLEGLGSCDAVMTWQAWEGTAANPVPGDIFATGNNDASGTVFPIGTNTVKYTLNAPDQNGNPTTQSCSFTVTVEDKQLPTIACQDLTVQLDNNGSVTVTAAQVDGGTTDNCGPVTLTIQKDLDPFASEITFDCFDKGSNTVTLRAVDQYGNARNCLSQIIVEDFFEGFDVELDVPEICLEANNSAQLDFSNYLTITRPNGTTIPHSLVGTLGPNVGGYFGITAFGPAPGSGVTIGTSAATPGDIGYVDPLTGVYTPGAGSGYVTISYILTIGAQVAQNGAVITGCYEIAHDVFELRQPLAMEAPECACVEENVRIVDLGVLSGGLEPYTIQYSDGVLDVNGDGIVDDVDGEYTYEGPAHDINDFTEDLGELRIVYNPFSNWSFTVVDARGCEIFHSGSCDNSDLTESPTLTCPPAPPTLFTEPLLCESQYQWQHNLPHDNCAVVLYNYQINNPDGTIEGPFVLDDLLNIAPGTPLPNLFTAEYEFQKGISTVYYYAEDAVGNTVTCSFSVTVLDDDPPYFINCPYPPVIENAETDHCDAYVNFALPLAEDNCDVPLVTQIDATGLTTGDRFPVGTTVMYWEAVDLSGNKDTCQVKVVVNDYWQVPLLTCPNDIVQDNDLWLCGAYVDSIAPTVDGPCLNNYGITYTIFADEALTMRLDCGVGDASGEFFDVGDAWVQYTVQNQPLMLITEVSQGGAVDQIEISNLGPADIDITCLEIKRVAANAAADETIGPLTMLPALSPTILNVGDVMVFDFAFDGAENMPACYTISYMGTVFDEVATNGFAACNNFTGTLAGGNVFRTCEADTDAAADWGVEENCSPLTIGEINPDLEVMVDNGTLTALQSILPNEISCVFKITIVDAEDPFCGKLDDTFTLTGNAINNISPDACNQSVITVPANNNCIIGEIVFNMTGTATPSNSTITLVSPYGTAIHITEIPLDSIDELYTQKSGGDWILDVVPNMGANVTVTSWSLTITCLDTFDMADQTIPNDPSFCGAEFTWIHPYFVDNCFEGTISVAYTTTDAACTPTGGLLLGHGGYEVTEYFCVGTTTVTYTLTDAAGNVEMCGFDITVEDVEDPVVVCPADIFVPLAGGLCGAYVSYGPVSATDNCAVVDTVMTPPSGSWFEIGDHVVTITVYDAAGNSATCTFGVHIIEHVPSSGTLTCNDLTNVSLDTTCIFVIDADAALEGDDYHCYDDYIVTIKNNLGQTIGNTFTSANIGYTYVVTVLDPETGNSCWTTMHIEDKLPPIMDCPADVDILCTQDEDNLTLTGQPTVTDCSAFTVTHEDQYEQFTCAEDNAIFTRVTRLWVATDQWGNKDSCVQTINMLRGTVQQVVFPIDVEYPCTNVPSTLLPPVTGWPSIAGVNLTTTGTGACGLSVSYTDELANICPGSYKIIRTWKVNDWCTAGTGGPSSLEHIQYIKVLDQAPTLDFSNFTYDAFNNWYVINTNGISNGECISAGPLPVAIFDGVCNGITEVKITTELGPISNGGLLPAPGLGLGLHNVTYIVTDECGNKTSKTIKLNVVDNLPPATSCDEFTKVSLGVSGVSEVFAETFDDGTYDNCCLDHFEVRRMLDSDCDDDLFGPSVFFCCSDINDTITVVLRAFDCAGNTNDCMVQVFVEDKIKPACTAPANVTVSCENFDPSLWAYGNAAPLDNCCLDSTKVYQGQIGLTHTVNYSQFDTLCNKGTIVRTFRAFDCGGNSSQCTQRIVVNYEQDYYVKFPNDVIVSECNGSGNYGEPTFFGEDCELLAVSHQDEVFTVVPDACFKIERTCDIINWCTYNTNLPLIDVPNPNPNATTNHPSNLPGPIVSAPGTLSPWNPTVVKINPTDPTATNYSTFWLANANGYRYKQIIKIIDTEDPVFDNCPANVEVCDLTANDGDFWNDAAYWDNNISSHDLCEAPAELCMTVTDSCGGANVTVRYLLFLDMDGDGTMETQISSTNPPAPNTIPYLGGTPFDNRPVPANQKYRFNIDWTTNGASRTACVRWDNLAQPANLNDNVLQGVVPQLPYGTHKIKWIAEDGCGNEAICEYTFVVKDCKKPTVVCLNGLSVNIMPTGMIQLWGSDFLQYGEDNCTPANQLVYGIVKTSQSNGTFPVDGQGNPITNVIFDCSELGPQAVQLWAMDAAGNADFCETYVIVQDNAGNCTPAPMYR
ncbi:MAG: HYR domain-containing protein [Lewinellaceae bacterium]|nr:HYR domain-containing protein [Lewinellaceae bacterium]